VIPRFVVRQIDEVVLRSAAQLHRCDLMSPYVWRTDDGQYQILIRAVPRSGENTGRIWLGESADGLTFAMDPEALLSPEPGTLDVGGCEDPTLVIAHPEHIVYYTGLDEHGAGQMLWASGPSIRELTKRGVALASTKTQQNTKEAEIALLHDSWILTYEYSQDEASKIGLANGEGPAGPWQEVERPFSARPDKWDNWHLSPGPMLLDEIDYPVMFYNGATRDARWGIGWMVFDRRANSIAARCEGPLISADWDGRAGRIVFSASLLKDDGKIQLEPKIMVTKHLILLAGASGDLGFRIAEALVKLGVDVRTPVRPNMKQSDLAKLQGLGLELIEANPNDLVSMTNACRGASCVVSASNGLREVIIGRQRTLLDAAVAAGVPRFISSDFSEDFTKTTPGRNRNLDLRRDLLRVADAAPIKVTSILNGAFMDMLGAEMPIIQSAIHRIIYFRSADQKLDFTTKDDVAAFTARAALDADTPRFLRIAGDSLTARELAQVMAKVSGREFKTFKAGGLGALSAIIGITKVIALGAGEIFPAWQGMHYMRDMFSGEGQLKPLDNDRYPDVKWTRVKQQMLQKMDA
jgi:predicted GH43/DUF377 family glycosyl hydrolase/uncharacterized protein YbjT (DUF2867 family)